MGSTGGESFLPSLRRPHSLNSNEYEKVRDENYQKGKKDIKSHNKKDNKLTDVCTGACKGQEWGHVTEKMIYFVRTTEGESEGICCVDGGIEEATGIRANGQDGTHIRCHGGGVMKRPTHCCMAIISHGGQKIALNSSKTHKEERLSCTAIVGDDLVP